MQPRSPGGRLCRSGHAAAPQPAGQGISTADHVAYAMSQLACVRQGQLQYACSMQVAARWHQVCIGQGQGRARGQEHTGSIKQGEQRVCQHSSHNAITMQRHSFAPHLAGPLERVKHLCTGQRHSQGGHAASQQLGVAGDVWGLPQQRACTGGAQPPAAGEDLVVNDGYLVRPRHLQRGTLQRPANMVAVSRVSADLNTFDRDAGSCKCACAPVRVLSGSRCFSVRTSPAACVKQLAIAGNDVMGHICKL